MRKFMGFERTKCDCDLCSINCLFIPGYLIPEDITQITNLLNNPPIEELFLASPGALVYKDKEMFRIKTIVPARQNGWYGCCKFFDGKHCWIHPVAPFGCAFFDTHQSYETVQEISTMGLINIGWEWYNESKSEYCKIWNHLYQKNLVATSPEHNRQRMNEFIRQTFIKENNYATI